MQAGELELVQPLQQQLNYVELDRLKLLVLLSMIVLVSPWMNPFLGNMLCLCAVP